MRVRSVVVAWLVAAGLVVPAFLIGAEPAAACSVSWDHVASYRSVPYPAPPGGSLFTATVRAVGDGWMDVVPDLVAYGEAPTHLTEESPREFAGTCSGTATFEADSFDPGWPVVVQGSEGRWYVDSVRSL